MPTLDWLNRAHAFTTAAQVPFRLLENVSTHGDAASAHHNLLIQGDNLEALKALLPFYRGQVKCIFIDPPYNTKSAFEHYDDNLEHSQWLSMMLPRLQLLRDLLSDDGSIWVTIDDNEGHYLKVLMDEVFGRRNFVDTVIWQKADSPRNSARQFSSDHDYMYVYSKAADWLPTKLARTEEANSIYVNPDNDDRGPWIPGDPFANKPYSKGLYSILGPSGRSFAPPPGRYWRISEQRLRELDAEGRIWWGPTGEARPSIKRYLSEVSNLVPRTLWSKDEVGSNRTSKNEMRALFPDDSSFTTPKPERLLQRVLNIATAEGDLVLDSFLGSGTTAAVAHKMGRRWVGISQAVNWQGGGGFRFQRLGAPIFDADGCIHPEVRFATLAAFVWQQETGTAFDPAHATPGTPHLGTHSVFDSYERFPGGRQEPISPENLPSTPQTPSAQGELGLQAAGPAAPAAPAAPDVAAPPEPVPAPPPMLRSRTAYYLLFNGILGDKRPASGNVLTSTVLDALLEVHAHTPHPEAPLVVYGEACRLGDARLALARVTFKHIPYDVKAR